MKKFALMGLILSVALSLTACGFNSYKNKPTTGQPEDTATVESSQKANDEIPTTPDKDWFYNKDKDVFYAGVKTLTFGKTEVVIGADKRKYLIIHAKIRNNSNTEQDPSDFDTFLTAKQKTETSNVQLTGPFADYVTDKGNPYKKQVDNLGKDILPGKTVDVVFTYELRNDATVSLEINNDVFEDLGTKKIEVK